MTPLRRAAGHLLVAAAGLTAGMALGESEPGLPLKAEREARFTVDEATWLSLDVAPSGDQLALEILGDLYLLPIEGGTAKAITQGMGYDAQPRFSPNGQRIAFVSDRDGAIALWTLALDGGEPEKLASPGERGDFASPEWSPDGQHIIVSKTSFGLGTYELWAYHIDGGKGVQITQAAPEGKKTPRNLRHNALGAVYSPDGRYLYYATKAGGFSYNQMFPQWRIARRDLREGTEDAIVEAQGSAMRPRLSPDGSLLAYGTRFEQNTGLRLRDLKTGEDRWLAYPVQRDDQESRYTRDLLPGYAFAPDGQSLFFTADGGIRRISIETGEVADIPFSADVALGLGPSLQFPWRLGLGPVKARLIRAPVLSPDGAQAAFSAFNRIHLHDIERGATTALSPEGLEAFHPALSPDGKQVAFVSWSDEGGHVWRMRSNGRGQPKRLTERPGFYSDPVFSPDGERIVALRATSHERRQREFDFGTPTGSDLIWLPANGGPATTIMPARGYGPPHFGPEDDRIYLYAAANPFGAAEGSGLMSVRYDGTDRRLLLSATGPGIYSAEGEVGAADIRLAPDGRHALIHHANQLHLVRLLNRNLGNVALSLADPSLPVARLTDVGADFFGWSAAGDELHWSAGNRIYQRPVADVEFDVDEKQDEGKGEDEPGETETADDGDEGVADRGDGARKDDQPLLEADPSVRSMAIEIYRPRHRPEGRVALVGARIHSMVADAPPIEDGVVLIEADRILAVGERDAVDIPTDVERIDLAGNTILPGYVDTHAHFRVLRRVHGGSNPTFLANLAYGVTTGLDVQPSTTDILAYEDLIDAGLLIGPRALSTGPGIFNHNEFRSARHAEAVLTRYRDHYRVHNLKAYISGNRRQRQWLAQAARKLKLMPTTEGALDMKLNMTHAIDGFSGNEHNFPIVDLHADTVELVTRSGMSYTPTLLVTYGGPWAENFFYTTETPHDDAKLRRFTPLPFLAARTLRRFWFHEREYSFPQVAANAAKIIRAGGRVGVGAHGQLQGLGYHWELWALASGGLTPTEALTAATRHGAEIIGVAQDIGTVEAGKLADLVVLNSDPMNNIRNTADLALVVKGGEVFEADTLNQIWPEQTPLPPQCWQEQGP
ncbi:MAG: amidohydrolase family protein [Gammaproteobacteria bacterium]|nr:amidohydrolase family protein [Gammaproteobacteria bacterium]